MAVRFSNQSNITFLKLDRDSGTLYEKVPHTVKGTDELIPEEEMLAKGAVKVVYEDERYHWARFFRSTEFGYVGIGVRTFTYNGAESDSIAISIANDAGNVVDKIEFVLTNKYGLSRFGQVLAKMLDNIEPGVKYAFSFNKTTDDNGKASYAVYIKDEQDNYIKHAWKKDNLPEAVKKIDFKGKEIWDFSEISRKLLSVVEENTERLSPKRFNTLKDGTNKEFVSNDSPGLSSSQEKAEVSKYTEVGPQQAEEPEDINKELPF